MKRALFLIAIVAFLFLLSGCWLFYGSWDFVNDSSLEITVWLDGTARTRDGQDNFYLKPGETMEVGDMGRPDYTYSPERFVDTDYKKSVYYFWDTGKPKPF